MNSIQLNDITIQTSLQFGFIIVISLDGQPISSSRNLLIQIMSEDESYGWDATTGTIRQILNIGGFTLNLLQSKKKN